MLARVRNIAERLRGTYWFVPSVMLLGSAGVAAGMTWLDDQYVGDRVARQLHLYGGDISGARALLSTVGGTAITVAGTVFSITIAALTLASSQFGPRLLRNFMRDRGNQVVLGTFVSTFLYCLLIQRTLGGSDTVPHLSTSVAVLLGLADLCVLVYFIHHVSLSIQAPRLAATVAHELFHEIEQAYPEDLGRDLKEVQPEAPIEEDPRRITFDIFADQSGYVQAIDEDDLMEVAVRREAIIFLETRPGKFLAAGQRIARLRCSACDKSQTEAIRGCIIIGEARSAEQDIEYSIHQLVEICLRALSPGINDPFTATTCIDWLGAALARLAGRQVPSKRRYDDQEVLRIVAERTDFAGAMAAAFNQPRQVGCEHVAVAIRLLETLQVIAEQTRTPEQWHAVRDHLDAVLPAAVSRRPIAADADAIRQAHAAALKALARASAPLVQRHERAPGQTDAPRADLAADPNGQDRHSAREPVDDDEESTSPAQRNGSQGAA